jgi:hypothetical protein
MPDREVRIDQVGSYNPNARESTTIINNNGGPTRMSSYFRQLHEEVKNKTTRDIIQELLEYKTKLDGTKGMEEKLKDGGFSESFIKVALRKKEQYAKKAMQFDCYPSAQEINLLIFIDIMDLFTIYVEPLIKRREPVETVMQCIHEKVVNPIMDKINVNGAEDQDLRYTPNHIYGMIYYLTGMCHINWKDYDNV